MRAEPKQGFFPHPRSVSAQLEAQRPQVPRHWQHHGRHELERALGSRKAKLLCGWEAHPHLPDRREAALQQRQRGQLALCSLGRKGLFAMTATLTFPFFNSALQTWDSSFTIYEAQLDDELTLELSNRST